MNNELFQLLPLVLLRKKKEEKKGSGDCFRFAEKQNPAAARLPGRVGIFDTINAFRTGPPPLKSVSPPEVFSLPSCFLKHLFKNTFKWNVFVSADCINYGFANTASPRGLPEPGLRHPAPGRRPAAWLGPCAELRAWHRAPGDRAPRTSRS